MIETDFMKLYEELSSLIETGEAQAAEQTKYQVIPSNEFFKLLSAAKFDNPHFKPEQFEKLKQDPGEFFCAIKNKELVAAAFLVSNKLGMQEVYINELQALKKGTGKGLLLEILKTYPKLWLLSEPGVSKLVSYYEQFNLKKLVIEDSIFGSSIYLFYQGLDDTAFKKAATDYYTE